MTPSPGTLVFSMPNSTRTVLDEHVELLERALVEQKLDALPRGQLAAGVLRFDALFAAAEPGTGAPFLERIQDIFHVVLSPPIWLGSNTAYCRRETPLPVSGAAVRRTYIRSLDGGDTDG